MITPLTMTEYMPIGLMGAFAAVMLAAFVSTNNTYMHSWGSIVVQDVVLPLRKRPVSNKTHLNLLRGGTILVGVYAICWSIFVPQFMDIWMFFALTGAIWLGGAGVMVIGGLYTRWGTTAGAYAALTGGSVVAVTGCTLIYREVPWMVDESKYPMAKYLTGQWVYFWAMISGITLYASVSLLGKRRRFNLEKLLHRGKYAIRSDRVVTKEGTLVDDPAGKWNWKRALGITDEFTRGDKVIYGISIGQTMILFIAFVTMTAVALFFGLSDRQWSVYHRTMMTIWIGTSFFIAIWLAIGGYRDAVALFRDLKKAKRDYSDDGTVRDHDYQEHAIEENNKSKHNEE
jgi:SSS family solute:Na+ symporter